MEAQQFSAAPQAVGSRKNKYRDPNDSLDGGKNNIMHDRRVVRGNTYASVIEPSKQPDAAEVQKQRDAQRRRLMRANQTRKRVTTPDAVAGRKHMDIQTDSYLEELTERTVEFEAETQTDFLLDRPPSPLFMPAKIGVDIETQIEDGELFDFDVECEPVLEVLVGKTLEQGMMEVLEEEELESLRRHQEDFERRRNAELLEVQRMEAAEKRRADEMERRIQQQAAQREVDLSTMRKVVSRSIAQAHLASLKDRALAHLLDAGVFAEPAQTGVDAIFMPNLLRMVSSQMQQAAVDQQQVANVMSKAMTAKMDAHQAVLDVEKKRLEVIDQAERKAREEKKEERLKREAEQQRINEEQAAMLEWEATQPPPPEIKWAVAAEPLAECFNAEERKLKLQTFVDGELQPMADPVTEAKVAEELVEGLNALIAAVTAVPAEEVAEQPDKLRKIFCQLTPGDDGALDASGFALAKQSTDAPADGTDERPAPPEGWAWAEAAVADAPPE